jgi:2'-5' RNA ligase
MRLFLAIEPDAHARAGLSGAIAAASAIEFALGFRWAPPENVHLTLHFLGEVGPDQARVLKDALSAPIPVPPFAITLDRFGVFPPSGPPRIVWLGVGAGAAEVVRVHTELGHRLMSLGFSIETRPFTPHLTVARAKDADRRLRRVRERLAGITVPPIEWRVAEAALVQSDLSGPRPIYTVVTRVKLAGTE